MITNYYNEPKIDKNPLYMPKYGVKTENEAAKLWTFVVTRHTIPKLWSAGLVPDSNRSCANDPIPNSYCTFWEVKYL